MNGLPLYRSVETAAAITDRVLVSFSGGKDSVITLDLCMRHFKHVECFFMYQVRGLSFQDIAVRLRVKKKVQNLNAMWYKEFAKNFATQGDFGHESP